MEILSRRCINAEKTLNFFSELKNPNFNSEKVKHLLKANRKLALKIDPKTQETTLHIAMRNSSCKLDSIKLLISHGVDVRAKNHRNKTPLHILLANEIVSIEVVEELINSGALLNEKDSSDLSPLHIAVRNLNLNEQVIKLLLNKGCNINIKSKHGSPLYCLISNKNCNLKCVKMFLDNKAGLREEEPGGQDIFFNISHIFSAYITLCNCKIDIVKELVRRRVRQHVVQELLFTLVFKQNHEILAFLLTRYRIELNNKDFLKKSILHYAIEANVDYKIIEVLLENGANVNSMDSKKDTPLNYALRCRNKNVIEILLERGACVTQVNVNGMCPLGIIMEQSIAFPKECKPIIYLVIEYVLKYKFINKTDLMSNFQKKSWFEICPNNKCKIKSYLYSFIDRCQVELLRMNSQLLMSDKSLFEVIKNNNFYINEVIVTEILGCLLYKSYPIYKHHIIKRIPRLGLLDVLYQLHVYSIYDVSNFSKKIILNVDCLESIANFLNVNDIFNLCLAYIYL